MAHRRYMCLRASYAVLLTSVGVLGGCSSGSPFENREKAVLEKRIPASCEHYQDQLARCFSAPPQETETFEARLQSTKDGLVAGIVDEATFQKADARCRRATEQLSSSCR